jgi:signal transduction histidine kinase
VSEGGGSGRRSELIVAQLANDLRNILSVAASCVDSLRTCIPAGPDVDTAIADLDRALEGAFHVSRELFGLVRRESLQTGVVDINELVLQARSAIERIVGSNIRTAVYLAAVTPIVHADAIPLEWVLLNLAWNAADAMPNGGVLTIETESTDVPVHGQHQFALRNHRHVRVTVSDTGMGMTKDIRSRAFEPFFTTKKNSRGLGLTSAAMIVGRLGGWLNMQDNPPRGTRVDIYLPVMGAMPTGS